MSFPLFTVDGQLLGEWPELPRPRSIIEHIPARTVIRQQIVVLQISDYRIIVGPRLTPDVAKPFIELDWHLGVAYCHKCGHLEEMPGVDRVVALDVPQIIQAFVDFTQQHCCAESFPGHA